jgi:nicotinamidase-related amidase
MQSQRLNRNKAIVIAIDLQEKLLPAMFEKERVLQNSIRLVKGAAVLGVPVLATEQYRKGLGVTVPEVAGAIAGFSAIEKLEFSACGADAVTSALRHSGATDVILCGIEAHVCVSQTCLDLLNSGRRVFVCADATSSRTAENRVFGIERMRQAGAIIGSAEMILFELLQRAGTEEFKQVLGLVK